MTNYSYTSPKSTKEVSAVFKGNQLISSGPAVINCICKSTLTEMDTLDYLAEFRIANSNAV